MTWIEGIIVLVAVLIFSVLGFMLWQVTTFFFFDGSFQRALIAAIILAGSGNASTVVRK